MNLFEKEKEWFNNNYTNLFGTESGIQLQFKTETPDTVSADRWHSSMAADEEGQQWVADCWLYTVMMNILSATKRTGWYSLLLNSYNPYFADAHTKPGKRLTIPKHTWRVHSPRSR